MTTYAPNPHFFEPEDAVWAVPNDVLTAEIEDARKHLAKAIEAKGEDYVYTNDTEAVVPSGADNCLYLRYESAYWDEDNYRYLYEGPKGPSCIVGHVLVYKEVPTEKITACEGDNAAAALSTLGTYTSSIVREALHRVQSKQDHLNGYTWGQAVEEFEAYINEKTVRVDG